MVAREGKVGLTHLSRKAVVYVRQSTAQQVRNNEESTRRQYALADAVTRLGWQRERIEVIDEDLGVSGKFADNRPGFQRLVSEVAMGEVGIVACIEASRLSRSGSDWGRIIELCAMSDTLIMDGDSTYDARDPNDRLLLGVKGSITEMELYNIRMRMQGGLLNKAQRGELRVRLPVGYAYDPLGRIVMDPAEDVQAAVRELFATFEREGSAYATVRSFRDRDMPFPHNVRTGPNRGTTEWDDLTEARAVFVLKHPMYCGRYVYGRTKVEVSPAGRTTSGRPEDELIANIPDHHPAYITEAQFRRNVATLEQNAATWKPAADDDPTVAGRGSALLQGIVWCGTCGRRMGTAYQHSTAKGAARAFPLYICDGGTTATGGHSRCTQINGTAIDEMLSERVASRLTDVAAREACEVRLEVQRRWDESERALALRVERAEYEAQLMMRRYLACDPDNALVRVELERAYNELLVEVARAQDALEAERLAHSPETEDEVLARVEGLEQDFRAVWDDPEGDAKTKKRLLRTIVDSVTLTRVGDAGTCLVQVLYSGGGTDEFTAPCTFYGPNSISWRVRNYLTEHGTEHTASELAEGLNSLGLLRTNGNAWTTDEVTKYMHNAGIETKRQHYEGLGWIYAKDLAAAIGISKPSLGARVKRGLYDGMYVMVTDTIMMFAPEAVGAVETKGRWGGRPAKDA